MLALDWKLTFVVGLPGITAAGLWLMVNASRRKSHAIVGSQFRAHSGKALLISATSFFLIALPLQFDLFSQISKKIGVLMIKGNDPSYPTIKDMMDDPVRYQKGQINAEVKPGPGLVPKCSEWHSTTTYEIRNDSNSEVAFEFNPEVSSDLPVNPQASMGKPIVKDLETGEDLISREDFEKNYKEGKNGSDYRAEYRVTLKLKPRTTYQVIIARYANDRLDRGNTYHYFKKIMEGVKYSLTVDPQFFEVNVEPFFPAGKMRRLEPTLENKGPNQLMSYDIQDPLLPYQGFYVYWEYKHPKAEAAPSPVQARKKPSR
jgi:hypothetical protein